MLLLASRLVPHYLALFLLLVAHLPSTTHGSCNIGSQSTCNAADFSATISLFFIVHPTESNKDLGAYSATVIFHGGLEDVTVGPRSYKVGESFGLSHTFQYETVGSYDAGYTIIFHDDAASSCSGETFGKLTVLNMEHAQLGRKCEFHDDDDDDTPGPDAFPEVTNQSSGGNAEGGTAPKPVAVVPNLSATAGASCSVHYAPACYPGNATATSNVFAVVQPTESNKDFETYSATVIFHWGTEDVTTGPQTYRIGDPIGLSSTFQYQNEGHYDVGYSIIFGDDDASAGCSGKTYDSFYVLEMAPLRKCDWVLKETLSPAVSPPTALFEPPSAPIVSNGANGGSDVGGSTPTSKSPPAVSSGTTINPVANNEPNVGYGNAGAGVLNPTIPQQPPSQINSSPAMKESVNPTNDPVASNVSNGGNGNVGVTPKPMVSPAASMGPMFSSSPTHTPLVNLEPNAASNFRRLIPVALVSAAAKLLFLGM